MNSIHSLSSITPLGDFDLFSVPPTQTTVEKDIITEHRSIHPPDASSYLEFMVTTGQDEFLRLDKTYLNLQIRFNMDTTRTGDDKDWKDTDWANVSTVNNLFNALFKQVDVAIGNTVLTQSNQTYSYKSDFEIRMAQSKDSKNSSLQSIFWFDEGQDTGSQTLAYNKRSTLLTPAIKTDKISNWIELRGKLHLPIFEQTKAMIGGIKMFIKLIPNDLAFYLHLGKEIKCNGVQIKNSTLIVHRSKVSRDVQAGIEHGLRISPAKYPLRESLVLPFNISPGVLDHTIDQVWNGRKIQRAFVALVDHKAYNGDITKNPFNYETFGLNYLAFSFNGMQIPENAYQPDFDNNLYTREFLSAFEATNQDNGETCITTTLEGFKNGNAIYGFNFNPDQSSGCCATGHVSPIDYGELRLHLKFKEALNKAVTVLVYIEFDNILEITQERVPIYNFN